MATAAFLAQDSHYFGVGVKSNTKYTIKDTEYTIMIEIIKRICYDYYNGWVIIMIKKLKYIRFDIVGLGFIALAILFMAVAFVGRLEISARRQKEASYCEKEQEFIASVKDFLSQRGYTNCGVTMTRVMDENGIRHYTLTVHHDRISKLNAAERTELENALEQISFGDTEEKVCYKFFDALEDETLIGLSGEE